MHGRLVLGVTAPVTIGFLDHNVAFEQQPLQHGFELKPLMFCVTYTEGNILKITENRHVLGVGFCAHSRMIPNGLGVKA